MNILPFRSIDDLVVSVYETGSRVICNPPVLDTDHDFLVLVEQDRLDETGARLDKYKFSNCLHADPGVGKLSPDEYTFELNEGGRFQAWRRDELNLVVTDDMPFYLRSVGATLIAKELNLLLKQDRINLFRALKYAEAYGGRLP